MPNLRYLSFQNFVTAKYLKFKKYNNLNIMVE